MRRIDLAALKEYWKRVEGKYRQAIIIFLKKLKRALEVETDETKEMLEIYLLSTQGKATKEQRKRANKQFGNLIKTMGLGALAILPLAPLTLPLAVRLGKHFGIDIIPESFRQQYQSSNEE